MKNPTADRPTSISPHFDALPASTLIGSVRLRVELTATDRQQMFDLFATYFAAASREVFERDLDEKEWVALLREPAAPGTAQRVAGFSTIARMQLSVDGRDVTAFFSGDTIVDARFWGESALSPIFARCVFAQADRLLAEDPTREVYWFLICSGYKTYRLLPAFFREFYPHPALPTDPHAQRVLDALAWARYGERYDASQGVVRLGEATPLQAGIAEITPDRLGDPIIAFFAARNPQHRRGDELACLASLTRANLTEAGRRTVAAGLENAGPEPAATPAR